MRKSFVAFALGASLFTASVCDAAGGSTTLRWNKEWLRNRVGKTRFLRLGVEARALQEYTNAWNGTRGTNVQDLLALFADNEKIGFRDMLSNGMLDNKTSLRRYLERLYVRFPKQRWGIDAVAFPSIQTPGEWAVYNRFELYDHLTDEKPSYTGTGMDLFRFAKDGSGKLVVDEVHNLVDGLDISAQLGLR